jgi:hypothetical protein
MRERCDAGERGDFDPYGRSRREVFARMADTVDRSDKGGR